MLRGDGRSLSATDLAILAYPLDRHHVAVVLPSMAEGAADRVADGMRVAPRRSQHSLAYPLSLTSTVVWLSRIEPWHEPALRRARRGAREGRRGGRDQRPGQRHRRVPAALRQAQDTDRVRVRLAATPPQAPTVLRYADAGLEILLMQNDELARSFVENELGPLAEPTPEAARLRETLEASFRFGSHVAAAEHLQLHEHTVRNRLNRAQQLLGHSLQERRTELQVAVRILRSWARHRTTPTRTSPPSAGTARRRSRTAAANVSGCSTPRRASRPRARPGACPGWRRPAPAPPPRTPARPACRTRSGSAP